MPRRRIATLFAVLLAAVTLAAPSAAPAQAAAALPGGRPYYVVATLSGAANRLVVKLAQYTFAADGTVQERFWSWRQDSITGDGNAARTKVPSGYTTTGCRLACPIRTPVGFQHGGAGAVAKGTWSRRTDGAVTVRLPAGAEVWQVRTGAGPAGLASLVLVRSGGSRGWALGSASPFSRAVSMADVYASQRLYGPYAENVYGRATTDKHVGFHSPDYQRCSTGSCLEGVANRAADKRTWYHSYLATDPRRDGRKLFWNVQNGVITQQEAPGSLCISAKGGGHTFAALQALDDRGRLAGLVGVEASLNQRRVNQDIVSSFAMVTPPLASLVEA